MLLLTILQYKLCVDYERDWAIEICSKQIVYQAYLILVVFVSRCWREGSPTQFGQTSPPHPLAYCTLLRFQALVIMSSKYSSLSIVELMLL